MTDRELMQQALGYLERHAVIDGVPLRDALRERLAQPEQEHVIDCPRCGHCCPQPLMDERIESVRHMRNVQGYDGNWNYDPYMQGLYNGIEFALSLLEVREPQFKDAPATWLGDINFKRDKLSSEAALREKNA
jgi:hypothetical protein